MKKGTPIKGIPQEYASSVGDIVTRWSYIESTLRDTAYAILGIGPKEGRIAVREPRAKEYVLMLKELVELKKIKLSGDLKKLADSIEDFNRLRDWLAHSVWVTMDDNVYLQVISGKWRPPKSHKSVSRRITPQGVLMRPEELTELIDLLKSLTASVESMRNQVKASLKS